MCTEWVEASKALAFYAAILLGFVYLGFILGWWYYGGKIAKLKATVADRDSDLLRAYDRIAELDSRVPKHGAKGRFISNGSTEQ